MTFQSCWTDCKNPQKLIDLIKRLVPDAEVKSGNSPYESGEQDQWVDVDSENPLPKAIYAEGKRNGFVQMWNNSGCRPDL